VRSHFAPVAAMPATSVSIWLGLSSHSWVPVERPIFECRSVSASDSSTPVGGPPVSTGVVPDVVGVHRPSLSLRLVHGRFFFTLVEGVDGVVVEVDEPVCDRPIATPTPMAANTTTSATTAATSLRYPLPRAGEEVDGGGVRVTEGARYARPGESSVSPARVPIVRASPVP
jgi:hypothetical protein